MNKPETDFLSLNEFKKFEADGDMVQGTLLGHEVAMMPDLNNATGPLLPVNVYSIFDESLGIIRFMGTSQLRILSHLPAGTDVRVVFRGEEKNGARKVRKFDVQVPKTSGQAMVQALLLAGGIRPQPAQITSGPVVPADPDADPFA